MCRTGRVKKDCNPLVDWNNFIDSRKDFALDEQRKHLKEFVSVLISWNYV